MKKLLLVCILYFSLLLNVSSICFGPRYGEKDLTNPGDGEKNLTKEGFATAYSLFSATWKSNCIISESKQSLVLFEMANFFLVPGIKDKLPDLNETFLSKDHLVSMLSTGAATAVKEAIISGSHSKSSVAQKLTNVAIDGGFQLLGIQAVSGVISIANHVKKDCIDVKSESTQGKILTIQKFTGRLLAATAGTLLKQEVQDYLDYP